MRIDRYTDPDISYVLYPWYVEVNQTKEEIGFELYTRLKNNPEETFIIVLSEGLIIRGFLVAYVRYNDVFIWQARTTRPQYSKIGFNIIVKWAENLGKNKIRIIAGSKTLRRFFSRKYGFIDVEMGEMEYGWETRKFGEFEKHVIHAGANRLDKQRAEHLRPDRRAGSAGV